MSETKSANVLAAAPRCEELFGGGVRLAAPAKINLNLLVAPRRADGYHDLDSYAAKVSLYDRIELRPREDGEFTLHTQGADCGSMEKNLAYRAARLLAQREPHHPAPADSDAGSPHLVSGVDIALAKSIPPGKGLGGGSSDAAAVLEGLNHLWRLHETPAQLSQLGAQLGSDVPLFLAGPALRMTGRGEISEDIRVHPFLAVLLLSDCFCGTPEVYRAFDANLPAPLPQFDAAVLAQAPPSAWRRQLVNQLTPAAFTVCPDLEKLWRRAQAHLGEIPVHMSGSGSALFVLCDDAKELSTVWSALPDDLRAMALAVQSL